MARTVTSLFLLLMLPACAGRSDPRGTMFRRGPTEGEDLPGTTKKS